MGEPLYLDKPGFNGAHIPTYPNINPGGEGVTFTTNTAEITIELAPFIKPIIEYVSIADTTITNVNRLYVTIIGSDGSYIQTLESPVGSTVVTGFPDTPLPANSILLITFKTQDEKPPHSVTISIIACFHPELTTTMPSHPTTRGRLLPTLILSIDSNIHLRIHFRSLRISLIINVLNYQ